MYQADSQASLVRRPIALRPIIQAANYSGAHSNPQASCARQRGAGGGLRAAMVCRGRWHGARVIPYASSGSHGQQDWCSWLTAFCSGRLCVRPLQALQAPSARQVRAIRWNSLASEYDRSGHIRLITPMVMLRGVRDQDYRICLYLSRCPRAAELIPARW